MPVKPSSQPAESALAPMTEDDQVGMEFGQQGREWQYSIRAVIGAQSALGRFGRLHGMSLLANAPCSILLRARLKIR